MRNKMLATARYFMHQRGVSLIELIVFIVVVSIALLMLSRIFQQATENNVDPIVRVRAIEAAQSRLDEILALNYDANTPSGGIPACGSTQGIACNNTPDPDMNDVDDFQNRTDQPYPGYTRTVTITTANNIKLIRVTVTRPGIVTVSLAAQRANF